MSDEYLDNETVTISLERYEELKKESAATAFRNDYTNRVHQLALNKLSELGYTVVCYAPESPKVVLTSEWDKKPDNIFNYNGSIEEYEKAMKKNVK